MAYRVEHTALDGVVILTPDVFEDERGFFFESYSDSAFELAVGWLPRFTQDNQSRSQHGVIRGLHYQREPSPQAKLVRCARGAIWDVVVDVRVGSKKFGKWYGVELTEDNHAQLWIPEGYAHGFMALSDVADLQYKVTCAYDRDAEASVLWSDCDIGITWPLDTEPIVSPKDAAAPQLKDALLMETPS